MTEKEIEECKQILSRRTREKERKEKLATRYATMDRRQKELSKKINTRYDAPVQRGPVQGANAAIPSLRASVWI